MMKKMNPAEETHLHLELKVLVLPLPAEDVARNANFNRLLKDISARPERPTDQVLHRKSAGGRKERRREERRRRRQDESEVSTQRSDQFMNTTENHF